MKRNALFLLLLIVLPLVFFSKTANASYCNFEVNGSNSTYSLQNACVSYQVSFDPGAYNDRLLCGNYGPTIDSVVFSANTYNNSIINCTFASASISSLHAAFNNIISPYGSYNLSFSDNDSNIGLGYYFTFIPKDINGDSTFQAFAAVNPYGLAKLDFAVFDSQNLNQSGLKEELSLVNYSLPRFGVNYVVRLSNESSWPLETEQISKNGTKSFNPYWFICPDWGADILSYLKFNLTSNKVYTPFFLKPNPFFANVQFPDKSDIFWNFTARNYSNAKNVTAIVFAGYQFEPPPISEELHNFTFKNDLISDHVGVQEPGIYQFIGQLRAFYNNTFEQANSTTINYGVGLAFCTNDGSPLIYPGHYSMAFKSLHPVAPFAPTDQICPTAVSVLTNNITIDCRGGEINSTKNTIVLNDAKNVTIENCKLFGNAINVVNSQVTIINSTLRANAPQDVAFVGSDSSLQVLNTKVLGYSRYSELNNSPISALNETSTTTAPVNTSKIIVANSTVSQNPVSVGTNYYSIFYPVFIFWIAIVVFLVYIFTKKTSKRERRARGSKRAG